MPRKKVTCSGCHSISYQDVDTSQRLRVDACADCGGYGVMDMGQGFSLTQLPHPNVHRTTRWDCRMIERTLEGSTQYRALMVSSFELAGYAFIGFHGCGFNSACSMLRGGIDPAKNTVGARGRGFYVGSRYDGIPKTWAAKAERKGHGVATILAVYVREFSTLTYGTDYDWGLMDGKDKVEREGLEIVFFGDACKRLCVVPAIEDKMSILWQTCPHDSLSPDERSKTAKAAAGLGISYEKLARWISREELEQNLKSEQMKKLEAYF